MNYKTILSKNEIDLIIEQEQKIPRDYIYAVWVFWNGRNSDYTDSEIKVYGTKFLDEAEKFISRFEKQKKFKSCFFHEFNYDIIPIYKKFVFTCWPKF